jgi:hypothetical protein
VRAGGDLIAATPRPHAGFDSKRWLWVSCSTPVPSAFIAHALFGTNVRAHEFTCRRKPTKRDLTAIR